MSSMTAVFIPTLGRPQRLAQIEANLRETTRAPYRLYFIAEKHDHETIRAVREVGANLILNTGASSYASCINTAFAKCSEPFS